MRLKYRTIYQLNIFVSLFCQPTRSGSKTKRMKLASVVVVVVVVVDDGLDRWFWLLTAFSLRRIVYRTSTLVLDDRTITACIWTDDDRS